MSNEIISYIEMCQREGVSLQKGMNYRLKGHQTIILMSVRHNAPYNDKIEDNGTTIIYEGHDVNRFGGVSPKEVDQPEFTPSGGLTENGKFNKAAQDYKKGIREPELIRVYEKIRDGIWSNNGLFVLVDSWTENDKKRNVFKFKLLSVEEDQIQHRIDFDKHRRIIPTSVKVEVWKRDGGKCVLCGATNELHFDHIIPYSKGGTSITSENVQILCARHNLQKSGKLK